MRFKRDKIYALYKGDKFIDLGTTRYLAKKLGLQERTIKFYGTELHKKRTKSDDVFLLIEVEEDEEENDIQGKDREDWFRLHKS